MGVWYFSHRSIPIAFLEVIREKDSEDIKDLLQECQSNLSRSFFNKNESKSFWNISEQLIKLIKTNSNDNIFEIFK